MDYLVADVLDLPVAWTGRLGRRVDIRTVQSLEPVTGPSADRRDRLARRARTASRFVRCFGRDDDTPRGSTRPWPLSRRDLAGFADAGLVEEAFADQADPAMRGRSFTVRYRRPAERPPA